MNISIYFLFLIPMTIVGIGYRKLFTNGDPDNNRALLFLLAIVAVAEGFFYNYQYGEMPSIGILTALVFVSYRRFKDRLDPEATMPRLYMQDGRAVLYLPNANITSKKTPEGQEDYIHQDYEYIFEEVSVNRNYSIITIAGNGIKTTLEHSDVTESGSPVSKEYFQNETFKYNDGEIKIIDAGLEELVA